MRLISKFSRKRTGGLLFLDTLLRGHRFLHFLGLWMVGEEFGAA